MKPLLCPEVNGSTQIEFDGKTIELGGAWQRLTMREAIKKWAEIDYVEYPTADELRKAISKKFKDKLLLHRAKFVAGAAHNQIDEATAGAIFDDWEEFARYGFNKSHAADYGVIAVQTAYLKTHYPVEFVAAMLTSETGNMDKVVKYINEARTMGITVLPPDVNSSDVDFTPIGEQIRFGLRAIRNVGENTATAQLRNDTFQIVAAHFSSQSIDYRTWNYRQPTAILLGAELLGVSAEAAALADAHIVIPMRGMVESLNVSVAAALILYEAARQREQAGLYARCRLDPATCTDLLFEWSYPAAARILRAKGLPYPALDAEGFIVRELAASLREQRKGRRISGAAS